MKTIREVDEGGRCVLRTDTYCHDLTYFDDLILAALADFPGLQRSQVLVAHFGGERIRNQWGIQFHAPGPVPESYDRIRCVEFSL